MRFLKIHVKRCQLPPFWEEDTYHEMIFVKEYVYLLQMSFLRRNFLNNVL